MKKKSLFHKVYVIVLMLFFTGVGVTIVVKPETEYSRNENRYLQKMPALTWDSYKTGDFGEQFDKAVTDQFPFRDFFTGMSTNIRKIMGFHDVGDVYLGKDHYYFDKKLEKDMPFSQYNANIASIRQFADAFRAKEAGSADAEGDVAAAGDASADAGGADAAADDATGATAERPTFQNLKVMLIPSPASVLSDDLPSYAKIYDDTRYFEAAKSMFGEDFIDMRETLKAARSGGATAEGSGTTGSAGDDDSATGDTNTSTEADAPSAADGYLYFRTDHHWTDRGAYEAYRVYEEAMGRPVKSREDFQYRKVSDGFYGTMFSRALDNGAVPDTIEIPTIPENITVKAGEKEMPFYDESKVKEKDQYALYFGGNYPAVTITNPNVKEEKRLLVFKDSFANSFIPLILDDYSEIVMLDPRYETRPMTAVMNMYHPDDVLVLFEMSNFTLTKEIARMGMM
ncbi:MAG: hypothetical protein IKQ97_07020 [Eubacterium sp.]|nr:hypothetical protein [Eubacterium sp.]